MDPHYHSSGENNTLLPHLYDSLTRLDASLKLRSGLAASWQRVDTNTWEFNLRDDVVFHDGTTFTSAAVLYTLHRIPQIKNSPGTHALLLRDIESVETIGDYRIRIHTRQPSPLLAHDLAGIMILPEHLGFDVDTHEFNSGEAAIGTGPFQFVAWKPGQQLVLRRNERYWDEPPHWQDVIMKPIGSDPTRVASLFNGEVDLIDQVPLADRELIEKRSDVQLWQSTAARLMFVHLDSARTVSPYLRDKNGQALSDNPLQDTRVRQALSLAIHREQIIQYLLEGLGDPASGILPSTFGEGSSSREPQQQDQDKARQLLTSAGYPDGFTITLHTPSDRYPNAVRIAQAIAQMWSKIGVRTEVEAVTRNVFFPAAARQKYSAYFAGWAETSVLRALLGLTHSYDPESGFGAGNRARYVNTEADRLLEEANLTNDDSNRATLLTAAQDIVFHDDQGIIPLYHPHYVWAGKNSLDYEANPEGATQAMRASSVEVTPR